MKIRTNERLAAKSMDQIVKINKIFAATLSHFQLKVQERLQFFSYSVVIEKRLQIRGEDFNYYRSYILGKTVKFEKDRGFDIEFRCI